MFYFLTHMIDSKLAGLEIAMINRLKVFNYNKEKAKIVTFQYNRFQHINTKKFGISDYNFLNMFDYFQESTEFKLLSIQDNYISEIFKKLAKTYPGFKKEWTGNLMNIYHKSIKVAEMSFFDNSLKYVSNLKWYGSDNEIIRDDGYDSRGFLSISSFFGQKGGVSSETIYNIHGISVINLYYHEKSIGGDIENTAITLKYHGVEQVFLNIEQLTAFFYDLVTNDDSDAIFIADRSYLVDKPLFLMKNRPKIFEFWHNTFSSSNNQYGRFSDTMIEELCHPNLLSGYILPTEKGARDLKKRLPKNITVYNGTVALVSTIHEYNAHYNPNKIIMVARIDRQKQIDHGIKAFALIHEKLPDAKLYIYGYIFDQEYNNELLELTQHLGLEKYIIFENYTIDKESIYEDAAIMIMTSKNEGWGMVINESLSYGVPVISYDTCYGPAEIITNADDGYIVNINDYRSLSQKSIYILSHQSIRKSFAMRAINNMQRYNIENVANIWKKLSIDMKTISNK